MEEEEFSVDSESDSSEELDSTESGELNSSDSSDEEMIIPEHCVANSNRVQSSDFNDYYSDGNEDDAVHAVDPHCSNKFGLAAIGAKDVKRQQLTPAIKLLNEKKRTIFRFLNKARSLSDVKFKEVFRVKRETAQHLSWLMESQGVFPYKPLITHDRHGVLEQSELNKFCFLLLFWYLSNAEPLQDIADELGIPLQYIWQIICRVISWIRIELSYVVTWPSEVRVTKIRKGFSSHASPSVVGAVCIGAISSTQISIKKPADSAAEYLNKSGCYSVHLQVVATADHRLTNLYCGEAGSLDTLRVWKRSPLRVNAKRNKLILEDLFGNNSFLVGKPPYKLSEYILHPYERTPGFSFMHAHRKYNGWHFMCHRFVVDAVNLLKGRFRRLKYVDYYCLDDVPDVVTTCCILHNYCLDCNDIFVDPDPLCDIKPEWFEEGDSDDGSVNWSKVKPKMDIGDDRRGRLIKDEYAYQRLSLDGHRH